MAEMTRGEFALRLATELGLTMVETGGFTDVTGQYDAAVTALKSAGIVSGTSSGIFSPGQIITRAQAATMFGRAAGLTGSSTGPFADLDPNSGMTAIIQATGNAGLFQGMGFGGSSTFDPNAAFQDQHFAAVMGRNAMTTALRDIYGTTTETTPGTVTPAIETSTGTVDDTPDRNSIEFMTRMLRQNYGITDPAVTDFLTRAYDEVWSEAEFQLNLYDPAQAPWFAEAFPEVQGRLNAGLAPISAEEIISLRMFYRQILSASGVPQGYYDSPEDFAALIVGDVSPIELRARLTAADELVHAAAPEVRQAFANMFGVSGDSALYAYMLDDSRATAFLDTQITAAKIGAAGSNLGIGVGAARAMQLAGLGVTQTGAAASFRRIDAIQGLFEESVSEHVDLTAEGVGIDAEFGLTPGAQRTLENRRLARLAQFSGGGGAASTNQGIVGLS